MLFYLIIPKAITKVGFFYENELKALPFSFIRNLSRFCSDFIQIDHDFRIWIKGHGQDLTHLTQIVSPESSWENNHWCVTFWQELSKIHKMTTSQLLKMVLGEKSCHFENLLIYAKMSHVSDYCLSLTQNSNLSQGSESILEKNRTWVSHRLEVISNYVFALYCCFVYCFDVGYRLYLL